jgi:hypothetical protein
MKEPESVESIILTTIAVCRHYPALRMLLYGRTDFQPANRNQISWYYFFFSWIYSPVMDLRLLLFFGSLIYLDIW